MNSLALLLVCFQACLVQSVFSQCLGKYGPAAPIAPYGAGLGPYGYGELAYPAAGYAGVGYGEAYGGIGEGNVAVAGELPVAGRTDIAGQVPIMGAVRFSGDVCAVGAVNIAGKCVCGCDSPYGY